MVLVAAGSSRSLHLLEEEISSDPRYTMLPEVEMDEDGFALVEAAALLGTRT